jgi:hypothetical protein
VHVVTILKPLFAPLILKLSHLHPFVQPVIAHLLHEVIFYVQTIMHSTLLLMYEVNRDENPVEYGWLLRAPMYNFLAFIAHPERLRFHAM